MQQVGGVPAGPQAPCFDAALLGMVLLQDIECHSAQQRKILGPMPDAHPTGIIGKGHVYDPVDTVFNAPMAAHHLAQTSGGELGTEPVLARLRFGRAIAGGLDPANRLQPWPRMLGLDPGKHLGIGNDGHHAALQASLIFAERFLLGMEHRGVVGQFGKTGAHIGGQGRLIILEGQRIVRVLGHDLLRNSALTAHRITGDHTARNVEVLQQQGNRGELIGLLVDRLIGQNEAHFAGPHADLM